MDLTAEQRAAAIQAVLDHGLSPKEASAAAAVGELPGDIGAELEAFEVAEHVVYELAREFDFIETCAAELARHKRDGLEPHTHAYRKASWTGSAMLSQLGRESLAATGHGDIGR